MFETLKLGNLYVNHPRQFCSKMRRHTIVFAAVLYTLENPAFAMCTRSEGPFRRSIGFFMFFCRTCDTYDYSQPTYSHRILNHTYSTRCCPRWNIRIADRSTRTHDQNATDWNILYQQPVSRIFLCKYWHCNLHAQRSGWVCGSFTNIDEKGRILSYLRTAFCLPFCLFQFLEYSFVMDYHFLERDQHVLTRPSRQVTYGDQSFEFFESIRNICLQYLHFLFRPFRFIFCKFIYQCGDTISRR
jgi:hypothetical protein